MNRVVKSTLIIIALMPLLALPVAVINPVKIFSALYLVALNVKVAILTVSIAYMELALMIREGLGL